jgi:hypothetical protein
LIFLTKVLYFKKKVLYVLAYGLVRKEILKMDGYEGLSVMYRAVCSMDPEHPEKVYVDICRDGFCSHDMLFVMQKKLYGDKLQRIFNDSHGIIIRASRDGANARLIFVQHRDIMAREYQQKLRNKYDIDNRVLKTFRDMMEKGQFQTISVPLNDVYQQTLGEACEKKNSVDNATEERALAAYEREEKLKRMKAGRDEFYARKEREAGGDLALLRKKMERSGD